MKSLFYFNENKKTIRILHPKKIVLLAHSFIERCFYNKKNKKLNIMKKIFLLGIALFFTSYLSSQDFEVSPLELLFNAEPGESQTKFLKIKNHRNKTETFILNLSDFTTTEKGDNKFIDAGSLKNSFANWVSVAPSFFELQPNEEIEVSVTMTQPAQEYGSKWGVIFVRTAKEQTSFSVDKGISAGMNISGRIAINIFQTPGTNKNFKANIINITEAENTEDSRIFTAIINNLADIITNCKVHLIVTNIATSEEEIFARQEFVLYPKTTRKIELELKKKLPKGTYSIAAILDYGSRTNLEGTQMIIEVK